MTKVSVIIPCYNAAQWIGEAIESCLMQTYKPIEVIVIDDGSNDGSISVIKAFESRLRVEYRKHFGGNAARNRGVEIASGDVIQFLDADDYLLPDKIAHQVRYLVAADADLVYGDWRHLCHLANGRRIMQDITVSGEQPDLALSLLGGWWVALSAILMRRSSVIRVGGWDEQMMAAQDTDLMYRLALSGVKAVYAPGCGSIYRRYGNVTVGTSNRRLWLDSHCVALDKAWEVVQKTVDRNATYSKAIARSYFRLARGYYDINKRRFDELYSLALTIDPEFEPGGTPLYRVVQALIGVGGAEQVARLKRLVFKQK